MTGAGPGAGSPRRSQGGFTLIEVVIVLAILGGVLGLVASRGPLRSVQLDLDAAAMDLAQSLQLARSRAIAQNRPVAVMVGIASYSLDGAVPRPLRADRLTAEGVAIAFAANGSSAGGTVALQAGGRQRVVRVAWLTGRVSVGGGS